MRVFAEVLLSLGTGSAIYAIIVLFIPEVSWVHTVGLLMLAAIMLTGGVLLLPGPSSSDPRH